MGSSTLASPGITGPPNEQGGPQLIQIRELIYHAAGIFQPTNKLHLLADCCARRMQALGVVTLQHYHQCLTAQPTGQAELAALLNGITVGETSFFRNPSQLDALRNVVLPRLVECRQKIADRQLRIWSAGCSTGEEPYTLGMVLLEEFGGRMQGWKFEIFATDINERSLAHAEKGLYEECSVGSLSPYFREKYFIAKGGNLQVTDELRAGIKFSRINLLDHDAVTAMQGFDLILCCNVLIYFDGNTKRRVLRHFYKGLRPHGYLFLGHSESLYGVSDDFRLVHLPSSIAYVKSEQKPLEEQATT
jgi:chemotaxis protein methyltransferase CheR